MCCLLRNRTYLLSGGSVEAKRRLLHTVVPAQGGSGLTDDVSPTLRALTSIQTALCQVLFKSAIILHLRKSGDYATQGRNDRPLRHLP